MNFRYLPDRSKNYCKERNFKMNLPNKLTVLRLILVPFYVFFLLMPIIPHHYLISLLIFAVASYTDHLDGKIARKYNMITDFGKFADPLADKVMIVSALACFVELGLTSAVALIIILAREFTVTSIRLVASSQGKVVAANIWGKVKTVSQIIAVFVIMLMQYLIEISVIENALWVHIVCDGLMWLSVFFTLLSGVIYIVQNFEFIKNAK